MASDRTDPAAAEPFARWLEALEETDVRALLAEAAGRFPELGDWLDAQRAAASDDPAELLAVVNRDLTPSRRFYDYWQANNYAHDAAGVVDLLAQSSESASPALIPVIERALTLATRAILKSDDSSGLQGDLVRTLLHAHAQAVRTSHPRLTPKEQNRLVDWIVKYRYDGKQDFFDPDIVAYAPGLNAEAISRYRAAIGRIDLGTYGSYPLQRLAVLDGDRDAIVSTHGGEPTNAMVAARIVADLEEAGLHEDAVAYAHIGVELETRGWDDKLVTFLVEDAVTRGRRDEAVTLRRDWYARFPSSTSFARFRESAAQARVWSNEREAAESLLSRRAPWSFAQYLLDERRDDEAWTFAQTNLELEANASTWLNLCERRAEEHPGDTLPVYRALISDVLTAADKRNYRTAATLLKTMRDTAKKAGPDAELEFADFLAQTVERNRRRPTCIDAFVRAKLIERR